jgi:hypothetical protein
MMYCFLYDQLIVIFHANLIKLPDIVVVPPLQYPDTFQQSAPVQ